MGLGTIQSFVRSSVRLGRGTSFIESRCKDSACEFGATRAPCCDIRYLPPGREDNSCRSK